MNMCYVFGLCFEALLREYVAFFQPLVSVLLFRGLAVARYNHSPSSEPHQVEGKVMQETVICHSKPASLSSTESSECGKMLHV